MGHQELWSIKLERDRIYAMTDMREDDGMRVADFEIPSA